MKRSQSLVACSLVLCGCRYLGVETPIIPFKTDITAGHEYSGDAIEFLEAPDASRKEVLANLGPPLVELTESRVLLYVWEKTRRIVPLQIVGIDRDSFTGAETTTPVGSKGAVATTVHQWGLFIAYEGDGLVCAHEVRRIETLDFEGACIAWRQTLQENGK